MSEQHTPEPWASYQDGSDASNNIIHFVKSLAGDLITYGHCSAADARRIVAAINACVGIETHELEMMIGDLSVHSQITNKMPEKLTHKAIEYRMQRDELLAFIRKASRVARIMNTKEGHEVICIEPQLWAAITKAKEGAA